MEPGTPVGVMAVQSILQMATQFNLSSFHAAGMTSIDAVSPSLNLHEIMDLSKSENFSMVVYSISDNKELLPIIKKKLVRKKFKDIVISVGGNMVGLTDEYNMWYEV